LKLNFNLKEVDQCMQRMMEEEEEEDKKEFKGKRVGPSAA